MVETPSSSPRLRVGFDDQIFQAQTRGGISKYFVELVERLPDQGIDPVILSSRTRNRHLIESGLVPGAPPLSPLRARAEWISWRLWGWPRSTPRPTPQIDLMHHTFTLAPYLNAWRGPRVVTVFDMTPELFPRYFPWGNPHFAKRRYVEGCDAVISITRNTADDLFRLYSDDLRPKTHIIPFGVGESFFERRPDRIDLPARYLLFVGVRSGYKDFKTGFQAFSQFAAGDAALTLVVVGGGPFTDAERALIVRSGMQGRVIKMAPTDDDMPEMYRRAAAFVFPSIYEGFGLPTLESLASGTPTVLADASCSREVGGDAALFFTPGDPIDLVAKLTRALSPDEARRAADQGPRRGREFSWSQVASMTADLYRSLIKKENR